MNSNSAQKLDIEASSEALPLKLRPQFSVIQGGVVETTAPTTFTYPSREILLLALTLMLLQIADGVLTAVGVIHLGINMEANPILRSLMQSYGPAVALMTVKSMAVGVIAILATLSASVSWLAMAFRGLVLLYTIFAIMPWSIILYSYFS
jgi:Domain of unknown function (DUF5658)